MILDNVDDANVFFGPSDGVGQSVVEKGQIESWQRPLEAFLPQSYNGSILLTSRNSEAASNLVDTHGTIIQIEPMKAADSLALLRTRIAVSEVANTEAVTLVQALEGIPLAITHAAAYIRARERVTIAVYLDLFRESEANQESLLNNNDAKDLRRDSSTRDAVITTWQVSFNQIQKTNPEAADLLALMSMFDRQGIPERLLHDGMRRLQFEEAIAPLLSFSLIRGQLEQKSFEMHRLVHLSTRKWVELSGQLQRWRSVAIKIIARVFPSGEYETWSECLELLPHSTAVLSHTPGDDRAVVDGAAIKTNLGWYLLLRGEYATAKVILSEAIAEREKELGVNHPDTLTSVNNLALVLESQGRYEEAEAMNRRALAGREKELGVNHPDTLTSVNNIASVLESQGSYEEAEAMNRRALEGSEKELGVNHPDTLTSVNNIASVLESQGRYEEAEAMNRRALEGSEKELGINHPDTLTSVSNLALVLESQGRYEEAEAINRRALEGSEKELGVNHPNTLTSVSNLALVLESQGRYEEAEAMNRRALEGREKELGVDHPHTLDSVYCLAYLLALQKRYEAALGLYLRACNGYQLILGYDHPTTVSCQ
jgi:tetratricopeptide (TPR) repeat protein